MSRNWDRFDSSRRCTAHTKKADGAQCRNLAIPGTNICRYHGANKKVIAKARLRLQEAADKMARELLGIAINGSSEAVRLQAIKDALDRAGLKPTTEVEVKSSLFEQIFDSIAGGSREESRKSRAINVGTGVGTGGLSSVSAGSVGAIEGEGEGVIIDSETESDNGFSGFSNYFVANEEQRNGIVNVDETSSERYEYGVNNVGNGNDSENEFSGREIDKFDESKVKELDGEDTGGQGFIGGGIIGSVAGLTGLGSLNEEERALIVFWDKLKELDRLEARMEKNSARRMNWLNERAEKLAALAGNRDDVAALAALEGNKDEPAASALFGEVEGKVEGKIEGKISLEFEQSQSRSQKVQEGKPLVRRVIKCRDGKRRIKHV